MTDKSWYCMCDEDFSKCNCDSHNCVKHDKKIERPIQNTWIGLNDVTSTSQTVTFPQGSIFDTTFESV